MPLIKINNCITEKDITPHLDDFYNQICAFLNTDNRYNNEPRIFHKHYSKILFCMDIDNFNTNKYLRKFLKSINRTIYINDNEDFNFNISNPKNKNVIIYMFFTIFLKIAKTYENVDYDNLDYNFFINYFQQTIFDKIYMLKVHKIKTIKDYIENINGYNLIDLCDMLYRLETFNKYNENNTLYLQFMNLCLCYKLTNEEIYDNLPLDDYDYSEEYFQLVNNEEEENNYFGLMDNYEYVKQSEYYYDYKRFKDNHFRSYLIFKSFKDFFKFTKY